MYNDSNEANKDIFDLSIAKEAKSFIKNSLLLESDVASDVLDAMAEFPWLGSLIKLGRVGKSYLDFRFVCKIGKFLQQSEFIEQEKKEAFVSKLNRKDRKRMYEYLMHLLYSAEEDSKAVIMGMVYKDRIMNNIDNDMFLRLCSSINKVYIEDVGRLQDYVNPLSKSDYVTNNLYSSGLLQMTESGVQGGTLKIGGSFELSAVGQHLLRIISKG